MSKKIIGILICMLLIIFALPVSGENVLINDQNNYNKDLDVKENLIDISLEKGDIVFVDITFIAKLGGGIAIEGKSNDHTAIYAGNGYFWESAPYTEPLVQMGFPGLFCGVQKTHKIFHKMLYKNYQVAKYQLPLSRHQRNMITLFCALQAGEDYQWAYPNHYLYDSCFSNPDVRAWPPLPLNLYFKYKDAIDEINDINIKDRWNCGELVWAAWMHAVHIDMDSNPYPEQGWDGTYANDSDTYSYIVWGGPIKEYILSHPDEWKLYNIPKWKI